MRSLCQCGLLAWKSVWPHAFFSCERPRQDSTRHSRGGTANTQYCPPSVLVICGHYCLYRQLSRYIYNFQAVSSRTRIGCATMACDNTHAHSRFQLQTASKLHTFIRLHSPRKPHSTTWPLTCLACSARAKHERKSLRPVYSASALPSTSQAAEEEKSQTSLQVALPSMSRQVQARHKHTGMLILQYPAGGSRSTTQKVVVPKHRKGLLVT